jgi:PAS domain S-box-containing protein
LNPKATVLVVDDNSANRLMLYELLRDEDYRLIEAADGPTALKMAAVESPDLMLLDVMMPGMNGFEVCKRLRAEPRFAEIPVIIVTALNDKASRLAGIEAGADDFITKPFDRMELRARVRSITRLNRYRRLHETREALRDSEIHFSALFALGPVAVYSCDVSGAIQDYNQRAVALWGEVPDPGSESERFSGPITMYTSDGVLIPMESIPMAEVCGGRRPSVEDEEYLVERADGARISVIVNVAPIKNDAGAITCAIGCFHDITARKAAESQLREDEQWLKAIFEQSAVGVVQMDPSTSRFLRFNQRFCDILGYSFEETKHLTHREITHLQDVEADTELHERLRSGSIREYTREKRYMRKDGSLVWTSVAVSGLGAPGEAPASFLAVVLDISERKRLDDHFYQAQKMEALGQFSGGVAHDFNNILAAIGGYTELSQMILTDNPEVRQHLGQVLKSTGRAADLVRQILTFSRHEPQERRPIQLNQVVEESMTLLRASIPSTITFETAIAADVPAVLANANQIHQILMNLGVNAWHAMREGTGKLQVVLERFIVSAEYAATKPRLRAGEYVRLSVSDTGCGMAPATLRRIFDPFFTTKALGEGTGLGLSVVHGIMDGHDGTVTVHSQPGEGTVFRLYFPVHGGEVTEVLVSDGPIPHGNGERIFIVEDEEILALLIQKTLVNLGYTADYETNPVKALALVRADSERYALVLSDQTMPGMTGLTLAGLIRNSRPELPVILMTGYSLSLTAERVEEAGVRQLILKPVTIQSLGTAVHAAISGEVPPKNDSNSPYR